MKNSTNPLCRIPSSFRLLNWSTGIIRLLSYEKAIPYKLSGYRYVPYMYKGDSTGILRLVSPTSSAEARLFHMSVIKLLFIISVVVGAVEILLGNCKVGYLVGYIRDGLVGIAVRKCDGKSDERLRSTYDKRRTTIG